MATLRIAGREFQVLSEAPVKRLPESALNAAPRRSLGVRLGLFPDPKRPMPESDQRKAEANIFITELESNLSKPFNYKRFVRACFARLSRSEEFKDKFSNKSPKSHYFQRLKIELGSLIKFFKNTNPDLVKGGQGQSVIKDIQDFLNIVSKIENSAKKLAFGWIKDFVQEDLVNCKAFEKLFNALNNLHKLYDWKKGEYPEPLYGSIKLFNHLVKRNLYIEA